MNGLNSLMKKRPIANLAFRLIMRKRTTAMAMTSNGRLMVLGIIMMDLRG